MLTPAGTKQLGVEEARFSQMFDAIMLVMKTTLRTDSQEVPWVLIHGPVSFASFTSKASAQHQILLGIKIARIEDLGRAAIFPDRHLPVCVARQVVAP
jgi:hypothetical protein